MAIFKGHLDDLLNTSIPYADFQSVLVQSLATDPSSGQVSSITATAAAAQPLGIYPFGPYTVISVDDAKNTFLVGGTYAGSPYKVLYYVLGYSGDSLLFGTQPSSTIAGYAATSGLATVDTDVGILSPSPVATGASLAYTQAGIDANGALAKSDFNGDGKSDLLLQNDAGAVVLETTTGLSVSATGPGGLVANPGPTWHAVATADFNGDGQNDILFQNDNGAIVDFLMNGTSIAAENALTSPGSAWHVRGAGDFNADGKSDIVLQNDSGTIVVDYTNGTTVTGGATIGNPGPGWTVEGIADFNGDRQPDILLQNTNGAVVDFLMNGATIAAGYQLLGPNSGYSVAGAGNYNLDNRADIVLHNDNGTDVVVYTNGTAAIGSSAPLGNPGAIYNTVTAGLDFNGDGNSDLLLGDTSGNLVGVTLDANDAVISSATLTSPGPGWRTAGGDPIQFIDGAGGAATLAATPGIDEFNFTAFTPGVHTITNFDAASDLIALSAATIPNYAALQPHETAYNGGTAIGLSATTALFIQGVTPDHLSSANFVLR